MYLAANIQFDQRAVSLSQLYCCVCYLSTLIQWRIYRGLTQQQLADKLGWHYQQLQDYEKSDYASATWQTISKVADVLTASEQQSSGLA